MVTFTFLGGPHHHHCLSFQYICCLILSSEVCLVINIGLLFFWVKLSFFFGCPPFSSFWWPFTFFLLVIFSFKFSSLASTVISFSSYVDGTPQISFYFSCLYSFSQFHLLVGGDNFDEYMVVLQLLGTSCSCCNTSRGFIEFSGKYCFCNIFLLSCHTYAESPN